MPRWRRGGSRIFGGRVSRAIGFSNSASRPDCAPNHSMVSWHMERKRMGLQMYARSGGHIRSGATRRYDPPQKIKSKSLRNLVEFCGRGALQEKQFTLLSGRRDASDVDVFYAGNLDLLKRPAVSIVGAREATEDGRQRAWRLIRPHSSNHLWHGLTALAQPARLRMLGP
jgi:hypothetical protein